MHAVGHKGPTSRTTAVLTEPTSLRIAPRFRSPAISFASAPKAPTGVASTTRSASRTRRTRLIVQRVGEADARAFSKRLGAMRIAGDMRGKPARRMACAIDEPIRPMPSSATFPNIGLESAVMARNPQPCP
jgi:hypothetical protein